MHRIHGLCGVVLAAGQSSRMGTQKPLLPWPPLMPGAKPTDSTLLSSLIAALSPYTEAVIVVGGKNAALLAPVVEANGAFLIKNPCPERGQFSSLRTGLDELLRRGFTTAMISPVDSPPLRNASLQKLATAFSERDPERVGVAPRHGEKRGHPLLATSALIDAFLNASADINAKIIKRAHEDRIDYVEVDDPFVGLNINTPAEYDELCRAILAL